MDQLRVWVKDSLPVSAKALIEFVLLIPRLGLRLRPELRFGFHYGMR